MIKANRPVSNIDPQHVPGKNLRGGGGFDQGYRGTPKVASRVDAAKDQMSDDDYGDALRQALGSQ